MKISKLLAVSIVIAVAVLSCKKEDTKVSNVLNDADNKFISLAGISNYSETEAARVALSKTSDTIVLSFARQMLTYHTNALSDLKTMGKIVGFTVKDTTDAAHTAIIAQLDSLSGRPFDSVYIHSRISERQPTVNFYADELKNGKQLNVTAYANANLQIILNDYLRADSIATAFY